MNLKDNELLVTGASGHSAKYFFERLEAENYNKKIKCLVRKNSQIEHLRRYKLNLEFIYVDFKNIEYLKDSMAGVKTVLHIANIKLSKIVIKAGTKAGVDWFICVHTTGRYSKFKSASAEYIEIEDGLLNKYPNLTILRPTLIYGSSKDRNFWRLINFINSYNVFPVFGSGKNLMQPVNAEDLGNAYFQVLQNRSSTFGKQYNLSGRDEVTYISILKDISSALGKKVFFIHLPIWISLLGAYLMNILLGSRFPISTEQVQRMTEDKIFSFEDANKDFGYLPINFKDGIRREVDELINKH
ncbi:NAD(P)H-binding protein [Gammaproteobacteria bacterium]|nr:NAD(P)H-binding protein [Gammaproteobacteria bacterium]